MKPSICRKKRSREEIVSLRDRLQKLVDQREVLQAGLELAERELARLTALDATQFVSDADQDRARASTIEFRLRLHDLDLSVDALQSDIRRNQQLLQEIPVRRKARAAELRAESRRLSIAVTENMGRETQRVLAPSAGIVSGLLVREGQTISMSNPLLNIVPEDGEFFAELLIPSRTIGFVRRRRHGEDSLRCLSLPEIRHLRCGHREPRQDDGVTDGQALPRSTVGAGLHGRRQHVHAVCGRRWPTPAAAIGNDADGGHTA